MAVKPGPGEVVEQTTRTRVLPSNQQADETPGRLPPLWDYVETITPAQWATGDFEYTIYRGTREQKVEDKTWIGKFREKITPELMQQRWGGGDYNIYFKCPPPVAGLSPGIQLRYNINLKIDGAPHAASATGYSGSSVGGSNDPLLRLVDVMDRRMAAMEAKLESATGSGAAVEAVRQAMTLNGQVFSAAMPAVTGALQTITQPHTATPNPMDDLNRQLMTAMIAKIMNPADPIEQFSKMLLAMKGVPGLAGGSDKTGIALELVRQVPQVASTLVQGIQAWQMAEEARARQAAILRGGSPAIPVTAVPPHAAAPPNVVQMPAPQSEAAAAGAPPPAPAFQVEVPQMPIETLEQMLCNIIADTSNTVDQAAMEACALIERSMPGMTDKMIEQGEEFLLGLFRTRPVLQQVANHPRLPEFVKKFIETVKAAPVMQPVNPSAPVA